MPGPHNLYAPLCEKLGYDFQDLSLLEIALTHRSFAKLNNERLEFLGDALLSFCIAEKIFHEYNELPEGDLSRLRANLVNGTVLAQLALELNIPPYLRLGPGEAKSGGGRRHSILANTVEAVIGAIYLDGGISVCQQRILSWFASRLKTVSKQGIKKDPKTELQEILQAKKLPLPRYILLSGGGKQHIAVFQVRCEVDGLAVTTIGTGSNRREAEQDAAQKFLGRL